MTRIEIAVSLLGQNFILSDSTIRDAFYAADRIIEISEEVESQEGLFGQAYDSNQTDF